MLCSRSGVGIKKHKFKHREATPSALLPEVGTFYENDFRAPFPDYLNDSASLQKEIVQFIFLDLRCHPQKSFDGRNVQFSIT